MAAEVIELFPKPATKSKCSFCGETKIKCIAGKEGKHICRECLALATKKIGG